MIELEKTVLIGEINEPNLCYQTNEFLIRKDQDGVLWAGSDGGCSCYDGFDPANYQPYRDLGDLRTRFSGWVNEWYDGAGLEAAAWEEFNAALMNA